MRERDETYEVLREDLLVQICGITVTGGVTRVPRANFGNLPNTPSGGGERMPGINIGTKF